MYRVNLVNMAGGPERAGDFATEQEAVNVAVHYAAKSGYDVAVVNLNTGDCVFCWASPA